MALGAGADVGFLSLMAGGLASLGKGEVEFSRDELDAVAKGLGMSIQDVVDSVAKTVERLGGKVEQTPDGGIRVAVDPGKVSNEFLRQTIAAVAPPDKVDAILSNIMKQYSASGDVDIYKAARDAGLSDADAKRFAGLYRAFIASLDTNGLLYRNDLLAKLAAPKGGGEEAGRADVDKAASELASSVKAAVSQVLSSIKPAGGGKGLVDANVDRWIYKNIDEPLKSGNFDIAVERALDVIRKVETKSLSVSDVMEGYPKIYDVLRTSYPEVFDAALKRYGEERLAAALGLGEAEQARAALADAVKDVRADELLRLEQAFAALQISNANLLERAALGDQSALDEVAKALGDAGGGLTKTLVRLWGGAHLGELLDKMPVDSLRRMLSSEEELDAFEKLYNVPEDKFYSMLRDLYIRKVWGEVQRYAETYIENRGVGDFVKNLGKIADMLANKYGVRDVLSREDIELMLKRLAQMYGGAAAPPPSPPPSGPPKLVEVKPEEGGSKSVETEKRAEEGGGKEVKTEEGQVLLLKEEPKEEAERSEAKEEARERGEEKAEEGGVRLEGRGQALLVEERPRLEARAKVRSRLQSPDMRIPKRAPLLEGVEEEVRRSWFPGASYVLQPRYGLGQAPEFAPPQMELAPGYVQAGAYSPYYAAEQVPSTEAGPVQAPSTTPETTEIPSITTTEIPSTTPETSPQPTAPGTPPQQPPQQTPWVAPVPLITPSPQPAPQPAEEGPSPIIVGGWPWYPAEGGVGRRYRPGSQRERLVL
jgi:hypothetical protein